MTGSSCSALEDYSADWVLGSQALSPTGNSFPRMPADSARFYAQLFPRLRIVAITRIPTPSITALLGSGTTL
jgi:hypothetical protein